MLGATWFVLAGMSIVFVTLGFLALVMSVINRVLGPDPPARSAAVSATKKSRDG